MGKDKKITPIIRTAIPQQISDSTFEPLPGEYHLVAVDANGNEKPGSDFSVGERTYRRTYANNPNFITKKKPQ